MNTLDPDRIRRLMMASIDGETTPDEEAEIQQILLYNSEWAEEYQQIKDLKMMTTQTRLKQPKPELWDNFQRQVFTKIERGIGWILFTIGAVVLLFYVAWTVLAEILTDPELAWWLKGAIVSVTAGTIILLVSLIRERFYLDKHERYKDVIR